MSFDVVRYAAGQEITEFCDELHDSLGDAVEVRFPVSLKALYPFTEQRRRHPDVRIINAAELDSEVVPYTDASDEELADALLGPSGSQLRQPREAELRAVQHYTGENANPAGRVSIVNLYLSRQSLAGIHTDRQFAIRALKRLSGQPGAWPTTRSQNIAIARINPEHIRKREHIEMFIATMLPITVTLLPALPVAPKKRPANT